MSEKTSKDYLAAAERAQQAANAALPNLASAKTAYDAAKNARAVLQRSLQNAKSDTEKAQLAAAIKNFDDRTLNPAKTAFDKATVAVNKPLQDAKELRDLAATAADAPVDSVNVTPLGNLADKDATAYKEGDPYYPNEGASGPQLIASTRSPTQPVIEINVQPLAPTPDIPSGAPAQTFSVRERPTPTSSDTLTPAELDLRQKAQEFADVAEYRGRAFENFQDRIARGQQPGAAYAAAQSEEETRAVNTSATANDLPARRVTLPSTGLSTPPVATREKDAPVESTVANSQQTVSAEPSGVFEGAQKIENGTAVFTTIGRRASATTNISNDMRVRISLAKNANYMYNSENPGILKPLLATDGVIFPYTPQISTNYSANYEQMDVTHSNYKPYNYKNSSVDAVTITADFTAQDVVEANYMLAMIHFFRSVTKMFYGKDQMPMAGVPPPLCYLHGYGTYGFNSHPIAIQTFSYTWPNDVNYINAGSTPQAGSINQQGLVSNFNQQVFPKKYGVLARLTGLQRAGVAPGGVTSRNPFPTITNFVGVTKVPAKISVTITALPIITRNSISNNFSLAEYSTGALLTNKNGRGGVW